MQEIELFAGNHLHQKIQAAGKESARFRLEGTDGAWRAGSVAISDDLLGKHLLFLGGIGTGKTNAIFHLTRQIKDALTESDVLIIFDTKGDFRQEFYAPGDVILSNDETATGPTGPDYWNIFEELDIGNKERLEENIVEIAKSFYVDEIRKEHQPFFPRAAKDIFASVLRHFCRAGLPLDNRQLRDYLDQMTVVGLRAMLSSYSDLHSIGSYIKGENAQTQGVLSSIEEIAQEILLGNFC